MSESNAAVDAGLSAFGAAILPRITGPGEQEDALRGPLENLFGVLADEFGMNVVMHGETHLAEIRVRPDYAVDVDGALQESQ